MQTATSVWGETAGLLLALAVLGPTSLQGQAVGTVEGSVQAAEDGRPLAGLNVQIEATGAGVASAADGSFRIESVPAGRRTLLISGLGVTPTRRDIAVEPSATTHVTILADLAVSALEGIIVRAVRTPEQTTRLPVPPRELPLSVATVDADRIRTQGVDDMTSALQNVTGVRPIDSYGGFQHYNIRGFKDFVVLVDGVRDERHNISTSAPMSNLAAVDRVEVLKGPASVLYGHSALGGVINVIRKQPSFVPLYEFSAGVGSFGSKRVALGAAGPLTESLLYRFDGGISDTEGWREAGSTRSTAHLALRWLPTAGDRVDLHVGGAKDRYRLDAGVPTVDGRVPSEIPRDARYNSDQDFMDYHRLDLQGSWQRRLSPSLSLRDQISYAWDDYLYLSTEFLEVRPENRVYREWFQFDTRVRPFQNVLELTHEAERDRVRLRTLGGYSLSRLDRSRPRDRSLGVATEVDLLRPVDTQPPVQIEEDILFVLEETVHGLYLQEFIEFEESLRALAGVRLDFVEGHYRTDILETSRTTAARGVPTNRSSTPVTFRLGAVWRPLSPLSFFAAYSTFFKQPRQVPADGAVLEPETGDQVEGGVRFEPSPGISLTATGYQIRKDDAIVALGQGLFDQAGEARSRGVELDASWDSGVGLRITGGYSYTDAVYARFGGFTGNRIEYAPDHQAHVWADYGLWQGVSRGLTLSLGGNLVGDNFAGPDNQVLIPAYTVVNGAVAYRLRDATISLNVNNLMDAEFFTTAINGAQLYPGAPRNFLLRVDWSL